MRPTESTDPLPGRTFRSVVAGIATVLTVAGCRPDDGIVDPPDDDPAGVAAVSVGGLSLRRDNGNTLTVLGSVASLGVSAHDSSGTVVCSIQLLGCSPGLLNERFRWKLDVPGVVSLEEYDNGAYPNGGAYVMALSEGRVEVAASVAGVEAAIVVNVVERARVAWSLPIPAALTGMAVGEDGTLYVSSQRGLQAVGAHGDELWSLSVIASSIPAIAEDGTLYVAASGSFRLVAVDPAGSVLWETPIDRVRSSPAIGPDGTIYLVTTVGTLYAVAPTGQILWTFSAPGPLSRNFSPPAVAHDGTIYFGSEDRNLYAINPDGSPRWRFGTGGQAQSPSIGVDGTIYFANDRVVSFSDNTDTIHATSKLFALNPDGTERWSAALEGNVAASPAIGYDGTIYLGSGAWIYAFDPAGSLLAKHLPGAGHTPIVAGDGSIYVVSRYIYALDTLGELKWEYQMKNATFAAPAIGFDGSVYAGVSDRSSGGPDHVLAFDELGANNGGYHASPWPQARGDRANTGRAQAVGTSAGR